MTFNKKRYKELLEYSQNLKKRGKHLSDICESDYLELLSYAGKMYGQLEWESRYSYAELISQFLNGKISASILLTVFSTLQESHEQVQQELESNLIIVSPNLNSNYVSDLIEELYWIFEEFSVDSTLSLEELKSLIEENSGKTVSSISKKLNYLIVGEKPTKSKIDNAKQLKINVIDQAEFLKMLNKTS